jgi:hypothetical protein
MFSCAGTKEYKNGDILKIIKIDADDRHYGEHDGQYLFDDEYVVLEGYKPTEEKPAFVPHLTNSRGYFYGNMGEDTPIKDALGRELKVGDTVLLFGRNAHGEEHAVVKNAVRNRNKAFVMSIECSCRLDGTIDNNFVIIKNRDCTEIKDGETVGVIKYVTEP